MSDTGRKDFTTQAKEAVVPDSQKSTGDKFTEGATDTGDSVASKFSSGSDKSTSQSAADTVGGKTDEAQGESITDKAKGAFGLDK